MIQVGCKGHAALRVTTENTARAMGSGELPVLATPAVAALVEKTCWPAIAPELELGMTTVGTSLQLAHTAPTPIGMVVQCDWDNEEAVVFLQHRLKRVGVEEALEKAGAVDGAEIRICGRAFEFESTRTAADLFEELDI